MEGGGVGEKKLIKPTKWPLPSDGKRLICIYLFILFYFPSRSRVLDSPGARCSRCWRVDRKVPEEKEKSPPSLCQDK